MIGVASGRPDEGIAGYRVGTLVGPCWDTAGRLAATTTSSRTFGAWLKRRKAF